MSGFGKASYGGGGRKNYIKIKNDGKEVVVRLLPPFGSLAEKGRWAAFYATHFGYKDTKGKLRPFQSCEVKNHKTKMIEVLDPASQRIANIRAKQDEAKKVGNEALVAQLGELLQRFNLNKKWYMNVVDVQGNIGIISIPHKQKMALDEEIKKLQQQGVDPISMDNGRYFSFSKTGSGPQTTHVVRVYQEPVVVEGHGTLMKEKVSRIDSALEGRLAMEATDLSTLYPAPTPDEILRMVQGNETDVEQVMSRYGRNSENSLVDSSEGEDDDVPAAAPSLAVAAPSLAPAPAPVAMQTSAAAQTVTSQPAAQASLAKDVSKMSNDEFLKLMGV
jgi:hypothetical protein